MKRVVTIILCVFMMVSLIGCSNDTNETVVGENQEVNGEEVKEVVELEFWHALSGENGDMLQKLIDQFNDENQFIHINAYYQGHYRELFEKLNGAAQANTLPTITMIYNNRLTAYVMNDLAEDLGPYIYDSEKGIDPKIWNDIPLGLRNDGMWDGKHYSLPFNKGSYLMFYNVDALEAADLKVPTTWEELENAARVLSKDGNTGLVLNQSAGIDFSFWVEQAGGHIYDEELEIPTIDSEGVKIAYEFITGMIKEGIAHLAGEDNYITGPMSRGESFIGFASSSNLPRMEEACRETGVNWAVAELVRGKEKAALFSGTDIAMFNTSTQEQKDAAWEFIKFWYRTDITLEWGMKSGYIPLTYEGANHPEFKAYLENDPSKIPAIGQLSVAYQDPNGLNGYAIHSNMQTALEEIIAGVKTIDEALQTAQENATREMEEAKKNFAQ
ncbi:ABC transporter substrate-binding protein [Alkaliphilus peptidifermentans]|uniref:Carbohydrate ABC transporter substrate-binding protein, CUT1 family (TC 3.A.1.1.-) n=1 Tax=Alkaliphilus peptidifermentans DSM 18978 TaxID=1120976 RepID=A0A1G5KJZ6_9FIRM|nr:ABC transporter substrate-binding protein [Alkaliphilus peptidifermentans]SCZ00917.1 carbohydrate ABC transporter substrate-binding protein, CUT1 family (TC 3.A.1.1.-) [Alkaliphilus peptidifermentans DSM 18978]